MHRLRTIPIAICILVLSATAVFAAGQASPLGGGNTSAAAASHGPSATGHAEPSETAEPSEKAEASESEEAGDSAAPSHPANHGNDVSTAAKTATPSGFANHGQYVSSIAKKNHGHGAGVRPGTSPARS